MITRSVVVRTGPEKAFRAWTQHIHTWWPPGHHVSGDPAGRIVMEAGAGGRFFERTADGKEFDYGRVLAWEPPALLRYAFFLGGGPEHPTEVEVRFTAVTDGTRVDIRHERAALAQDRYDQVVPRYRTAWDETLPSYASFAAAHR